MASNREKFAQNIQDRYKGTDSININLENRAKALFSSLGLSFQKIPTLNHNNKLPDKIEGSYAQDNLSLKKNPRVSDKKAEAVAMHEIYHHIQKDKGMSLSDEEHEAELIEQAYLNENQKSSKESLDFDLIYAYTIRQFYEHNELDRLVAILGGDEQIARGLYARSMETIIESAQKKKKSSTSSLKVSTVTKVSNEIKFKENKTGLPDGIKQGIESLSNISMDDVKVHYNSSEPEQFNAHAFAKGSDIHLALGAEKHLPHEAWHIVQQKQGRVQPTRQFKGDFEINDSDELEREADIMGERAYNLKEFTNKSNYKTVQKNSIIQREVKADIKRKVNKNSVIDTISIEVSKDLKSKYAQVTFTGTYAVSVQFTLLQSTSKADVSVEVNPDGNISMEGSIVLFEAKEAGKTKLKEIIEADIGRGDWKVDKVEGIFQYEKKDGEHSQAQGIKLVFHNQQEMVIKFNTFKFSKGEVELVSLNIEHTIPLAEVKLWERDGKSLTGKGEIKLAGEVQPNWTTILSELGEKGFLNLGKNMLRSFLSTLTMEGLIAIGFIMGGVVTLFSAYAAMDDIDDIDKCEKKAYKAVNDFTAGYCIIFGIPLPPFNASSGLFAKGREMAQMDLDKIIGVIQKNSLFSSFNFTKEELRPGIVDKIQQYPEKLYTSVKDANEKKILRAYILAFYNKKKDESLGITESKESYAYREAKHVAHNLGFKPESVLPKSSKK